MKRIYNAALLLLKASRELKEIEPVLSDILLNMGEVLTQRLENAYNNQTTQNVQESNQEPVTKSEEIKTDVLSRNNNQCTTNEKNTSNISTYTVEIPKTNDRDKIRSYIEKIRNKIRE